MLSSFRLVSYTVLDPWDQPPEDSKGVGQLPFLAAVRGGGGVLWARHLGHKGCLLPLSLSAQKAQAPTAAGA